MLEGRLLVLTPVYLNLCALDVTYQLEQELAIAREETEQLQKENKRMASTHDAFIRDHRKRLENVGARVSE